MNFLAMSFSLSSRVQTPLICLYLASIAAFAVGLLRSRGRVHLLFDGLFVLCLCPFIACALVSLLRLHEVIDAESGGGLANLLTKLYDARRPLLLGLATTIVMLLLHSGLYLLHRRRSTPLSPSSADRTYDY